MENSRKTEKKVNAIVREILDEDRKGDFTATQSETCPGGYDEPGDTPTETHRKCKCGVESSLRFSLRVMEAMRSLQRDEDQPSTSTAEDIVDYIRTNYRSDGDLYAQVRTALRQVCSQGFAMELLHNEYHWIGPVGTLRKQGECSLDCKGRILSADISRKRRHVNNHEDICHCERFPRGDGPPRQRPRSPREESLRETFTVDRAKDTTPEAIFHSTRISANGRDIRNDRQQRGDIIEIQRDGYESPIAGPSRAVSRALSPIARNAKKARLEDQKMQRADQEESTTEEDLEEDCICDKDVPEARQDAYPRSRPRTPRVEIEKQWNNRRRKNAEEDANEEEDEDMEEDSVYRKLKQRSPRRRTKARERELKRWIRRCREECERRRTR